MKRIEIGFVVEIDNDLAKVRVGRHSDCKNCGACPGNNNMIMSVNNPLDAKVGQKVCIEIAENKLIKSVYVVYIQPLLFTFIGIVIGYLIAIYMHKSATAYEIILGIFFFLLSVIFIKIEDKKVEKNNSNKPTIIKILS